MVTARTSRACPIVENEAVIATILRARQLSKAFKLWRPVMFQPATDLTRDILSPSAGNSIAAGQVGQQRDVRIKRIAQSRRSHQLRVASWWFAAALGLVYAPAAAAETAPPSPNSIVVEGNRRVDSDTVRSYFRAAPDGRFDDASRDAALKALIATGLFDKVAIERTGEGLVVRLTEAPVLDRVAFEGNKKIKDTELAAAIESKPRGSLQRAAVQAAVGRIIEASRHVGRDD